MTNESTPRPGGSEGTVTAGEAVTNRVTAPGDTARARRRWRLAQQRNRRRISLAFDAHLVRMYGLDDPEVRTSPNLPDSHDGDYWRDCGMHLGVQEREAAA